MFHHHKLTNPDLILFYSTSNIHLCVKDELFWSICNEAAYFPRFLSREAKHVLLLLLEKNPAKRLGVSDSVAGDIRHQPFFKPIDFNKLEKKQIVPPYRPKLVRVCCD